MFTSSIPKIGRPKSLTEIALAQLREDIVVGRLAMGAALSESTLSEQLGISRTPVREALFRLQTEGLVRVLPQRGTFVFTVDRRELEEIFDLRMALEMPALRFGIERQPKALADSLEAVVAAMAKAVGVGNITEYCKLDNDFHRAIIGHCGNRYLAEAYQVIAAKMAALRNRRNQSVRDMERSLQSHGEIAAAVRAEAMEGALAHLRAHIDKKGSFWITDSPDGRPALEPDQSTKRPVILPPGPLVNNR